MAAKSVMTTSSAKAGKPKTAPKMATSTTAKKAAKAKASANGSFEAFEAACLAMPKAKQGLWANGRKITDRISFRIDDSNYREFAAWVEEGAQAGGHLRYGEAKRLEDPRFARSTAFRGTKHNWMYVRPEAADWTALAPLIEESYRAAGQRGGVAVTAKELYKPLARGLALVGEAARPAKLHAAGPPVKIVANEGPAAFKLALWSAHEIRDVTSGENDVAGALAALDAADALRDRLIATLPDREIRMGKGYDQVRRVADELPRCAGQSHAAAATNAAVDAYRCLPGGYNERAVSYAGAAVEATARALLAVGRDVTTYLAELDRRALVFEVQAIAKAHELALPAVDRVLWRGADAKGFPGTGCSRRAASSASCASSAGAGS